MSEEPLSDANQARALHVIFGTGPVGLATARALLKRNHHVRLVNRSGKADSPEGAEVAVANALDDAQVRDAVRGASVVYSCAQPAYTRWPEDFPPLQRAILNAAADAGAKLVLADNLYMYGEVDGLVHEDLPYKAATRKGKTRAAMAREALAAHDQGRVRVAIGRASDFYGPFVTDSTLGDRVFGPLVKGETAQLVGDIDQLHTYTFIGDFGEALAVLGEHDEADGQAWHVPNAPTRSTREIVTRAFELAGNVPKMSSMGRFMMRLGGIFIPGARETVEMMYEFEKPFVVDSSKFERTFGLKATPLDEAILETITWFKEHPKAAH